MGKEVSGPHLMQMTLIIYYYTIKDTHYCDDVLENQHGISWFSAWFVILLWQSLFINYRLINAVVLLLISLACAAVTDD